MEKEPIHTGSHAKKIASKGSIYLFSSIATKSIAILLMPIYTRYLSPADYGIINSLSTISRLMPIFISLCLDSAYRRFYFEFNKKDENLSKYVSTFFWFKHP